MLQKYASLRYFLFRTWELCCFTYHFTFTIFGQYSLNSSGKKNRGANEAFLSFLVLQRAYGSETGGSDIMWTVVLVGNFEKTLTYDTKTMFCRRGLELFSFLRGTNSKATHQVTLTFFVSIP